MVVVNLQSCAAITTIEFQDIVITPKETHVIVSPFLCSLSPSPQHLLVCFGSMDWPILDIS